MNIKIERFIPTLILTIILMINISYGLETRSLNHDGTRVIMVIINRIDFNDLEKMPYTKELIGRSSIALMNTRASGKNSEFKSYATLGWGTRAEASHTTSLFYEIDGDVGSTYERRTGKGIPENGIINLDINRLIIQNLEGEYGSIPGILGQMLDENGYKTALIGKGDTIDIQLTQAGLIVMDSDGYIHSGDISDRLIEKDNARPFGLKTDYKLLLDKFEEEYLNSNLIVIETGDTMRLERYRENLRPKMYEKHKIDILEEIDEFIYSIVKNLDKKNDKLIIATPYPSTEAANRGSRLTPLIIYEGNDKGQVLYSKTTRREGIVGNVDVAPTILSYFNLTTNKMTGRVLQSVSQQGNLNYIHNLNKRVTNTSAQRYRVLYSFAVYQIITSVLALALIIFKNRVPVRWYKYISLALIGNMVVPLTLLLIPLFGVTNIVTTYLLLLAITMAIISAIYLVSKGDSLSVILYAMFLLVFGLLFDIVSGQNLIKNSLLGYDPILGARYYGIGNEYMGILIGAVLMLTAALMEKHYVNKYLSIMFYGLVAVIIGFPGLGANVGGLITAVFSFLFVTVRLLGKKIDFRGLVYIGLAVVFVVGVMALVDLFIVENKSHLAGAISQIISNGPVVMYQIITRKISMNLRIIGVTIWSKVLLSAVVVLGILFYKPIGWFRRISMKYPKLALGWSGIIVACVIGFVANDSGTVAAATSIIFLTSTMLYLIIEDLN
ncbi:MAG: hypothetical protein ACOCG5_08365 [Candidatus Alkaliphilus sp. MAG34]